jgi:energy-coupling factor transporter ATP-binding protein EcfA2
LNNLSGFVAYPSQPSEIGQTVSAAVAHLRSENRAVDFRTWEENDVAGRFIYQPILEEIDKGQLLVADVTRLNFNVVFEIGYAIGRQKRAYLVRNSAITGSDDLIGQVGIFDTLGYELYSSSGDLASHLSSVSSTMPLTVIENAPNKVAPVYMVVPRDKTDSEIHTFSRVKKARIKFRTFDPEEHGRLPAREAINNVAQSLGVITSLLPSPRKEAEVHNFRAAFVSGLAMGMDKPLLLLQEGEDPVPLDFRDLVKVFYSLDQINGHISAFSTEVMARLQAQAPVVVSEPQTFLERLNLGASSAENEFRELGNYYLETDEFRRVFRGEIQVVTGRKGAGKTALFVQVRDRLRSDRGKVVLDLKPEGFQLLKFKERVLDYLEEGTKTHTITAFWEYLLLLETCYKILEQDEVRHMRNGHLYEPYRRLADAYEGDDFVSEGDFGERMLKLTQRIAEDFEAGGGTSTRGQSLSSGQVTELLYKHDVGRLRRQVMEYLEFKDALWILFDNLDKGWPPHGVTAEDVLTLRCLIDALGNIEQQLDKRDVEAHGTVFIRNDVYELLVENTSDRGKVTQVGLDWTNGDLLRELLRRRFAHTGVEGNPNFEELWRQICRTHVRGEESSQYLIERCLMRPRALIELVGYCRSYAVNLGHERIELGDIEQGEEDFSVELLKNIGFEIRDVFPYAGDVLYEFLETLVQLAGYDILEAAGRLVGEEKQDELFERLLWYGIFGVVRDDDHVTYIYDARYDMRRLLGLVAHRGKENATFRLNPAFWKALEARV